MDVIRKDWMLLSMLPAALIRALGTPEAATREQAKLMLRAAAEAV